MRTKSTQNVVLKAGSDKTLLVVEWGDNGYVEVYELSEDQLKYIFNHAGKALDRRRNP